MEIVRLSVRKIVEKVHCSGDIDSRYVDASAPLLGARAHRMLQRQMGEGYRKEVALRLTTEIDGIAVSVYGRADGLFVDPVEGLTLDEIKTTTLPLERMAAYTDVHLAQAKCYAHMLCLQEEQAISTIMLRLVYYQLESGETEYHSFRFTAEELAQYFTGLLNAYAVWLRLARDWVLLRDESIRAASFPFAQYRAGQRELAVAAYSAIELGKRLYAQAPTGTGKTLSALFPSIKALPLGKVEKLFYLTAKTVTRTVAQDALRLMTAQGLRIKSVTLRAKEKICFCEQVNCTPAYCPYAKGHFDRVNDALLDLLHGEDIITPETIIEYAKKHRVCPHEFALSAAEWADCVIGDYNHVFDPRAYLKRFFSEGEGNYAILIDEAHNLLDRVRDMYTARVTKSEFYQVYKQCTAKTAHTKRLKSATNAVYKNLRELGKTCTGSNHAVSAEPFEPLTLLLREFCAQASDWLGREQASDNPLTALLLPLYFGAQDYLSAIERYAEHYCTILEATAREATVTLFCLDPSGIISERLAFGKAAVLFSATLTPLKYYREMLGGCETDGIIALPSPFPPERQLLVAHTGISTRYADRQQSIASIAQTIYVSTRQYKGNYLVFFPSYEYMRDVYARFSQDYPDVEAILQQSSMDEDARVAFLARFEADNPGTLLGFCVLGGIFSEGIDLVGERLIGAVITGVGLPKISLRQELIRGYFDAKNGAGYDYAYVYPGMNKVLQAAGRVVRTHTDRGIVVLIDTRFGTAQYKALYPAHWGSMCFVRDTAGLTARIKAFKPFQAMD